MSFPEAPRVIYRKSPISEVAVQLRFPAILKIDSELPAAFQDIIRSEYPQYSQGSINPSYPPNLPPQFKSLLQGMGAPSGPIRHLFESDDKCWNAALTRETLELKTTAYNRWEEFSDRIGKLRNTFEQIYSPAFYVRLGLRYVDIIRRSLLGLDEVPWSELLEPYIGAELSTTNLGSRIDSTSRQLHCRIDGDNCYLSLKAGLVFAEPIKEPCFLIESDFHTHTRTEIANVASTLNIFNQSSGRLFRWSIQRRLHDALDPEPVK